MKKNTVMKNLVFIENEIKTLKNQINSSRGSIEYDDRLILKFQDCIKKIKDIKIDID